MKAKNNQLALDFDNVIVGQTKTIIPESTIFKIRYSNSSKIISLKEYQQSKQEELLRKFYALSEQLD